MVLINLKLRTLDGRDNEVEIDDETKLAEFRDDVERVTTVPKERQRLIFRGHVLSDDDRTLKSYGLEDQFAIHIVTRPPETNTVQPTPNESATLTEPIVEARVISSNLIVGNVSFERTGLFDEPDQTSNVVGNILDQLRNSFHLDLRHSLVIDRPHNDDFSINVIFRGQRERIVNSPARERVQHLQVELRRLAWMVTVVKSLFYPHLDVLLNSQEEEVAVAEQREAYNIIANILNVMHSLDHFNEEALRQLPAQDVALSHLITSLENWNFADDEAHLERVDDHLSMRHCTADDISQMFQFLSIIENHINVELMCQYNRVLSWNPGRQNSSSFAARLVNCFTSAFTKIIHQKAHILHAISDFSFHADENPFRRVYPQYSTYRREEPPHADISLLFFHPRNSDPSHRNMAASSAASASIANLTNLLRQSQSNNNTTSTSTSTSTAGSLPPEFLRSLFSAPHLNNQQQQQQRAADSSQDSLYVPTAASISITVTTTSSSSSPNLFGIPESTNSTFSGSSNEQTDDISMEGLVENRQNATSSTTASEQTNSAGQSENSGNANQRSSNSSNNGEQDRNTQQNPMASFLNLLQAVGGSIFGALPSGNTTTSSTTSNSSQTQTQANRSAANRNSGSYPNAGWTNIRPILRPLRQGMHRQNADRPRGIVVTQVPPLSQNQRHQTRMRVRRRSRPRSLSPALEAPVGRENARPSVGGGAIRRVTQRLPLRRMANNSSIAWSQMPIDAPNAVFIGPRPPSNLPMFTIDPFLACSSRRYRLFEVDARHNDFWNDPITQSYGLIAPRNTIASIARGENSSGISHAPSSSTTQSRTDSSEPNGDTDAPMQARANNNGEVVFTEMESFVQFVRQTLESVAHCMISLDSSISVQNRRQQTLPFTADTTVYGFVPLILGRAAPGPNFDMIPNLQSHGQGFSPIPAGGSLLGGVISMSASDMPNDQPNNPDNTNAQNNPHNVVPSYDEDRPTDEETME